MTKDININGMTFEAIKPKSWSVLDAIHKHANTDIKELHHCYSKISDEKKKIYDSWKKWSENAPVWHLSITSSNRYAFTLTCILEDSKTLENIGLIVITKSHNRLYLID